MKKKGFTLVEIIVTIALIGLIGLAIGFSLNKTIKIQEENEYESFIEKVKSSIFMYSYNKVEIINDLELKKGFVLVSMNELVNNGYIREDIKNPKTDEKILETESNIGEGEEDYTKAKLYYSVDKELIVEYPYINQTRSWSFRVMNYTTYYKSNEEDGLCYKGLNSPSLGIVDSTGDVIENALRTKIDSNITAYMEDGSLCDDTKLNTDKVGTYKLKYVYDYDDKKESVDRVITVKAPKPKVSNVNVEVNTLTDNAELSALITKEYGEEYCIGYTKGFDIKDCSAWNTLTNEELTKNISMSDIVNANKNKDYQSVSIYLFVKNSFEEYIKIPTSTIKFKFEISYNNNGGTGCDKIDKYYGETYGDLCTPNKDGYKFLGWYTEANDQITNSSVVKLTDDQNLYAHWEAKTDTPYVVKHWQQKVTGGTEQNSTNYDLASTDAKTGTTDTSITPSVKTYTGFITPSTQTTTIKGDGSTVVNYYYNRQSYTVTLSKGTGISSVSGAGNYRYGASVTINATVSSGYTWNKWSGTHSTTTKKYTFTMPANNVTDTANATKNTTTTTTTTTTTKTTTTTTAATVNYTIKHWQQKIDGTSTQNSTNFTLIETETKSGKSGSSVSPAVKTYTGFNSPVTQTVTINSSGTTVVNYYYTRKSYSVTLNKGTGIASVSGAGTYRYGASVTINATVSSGYTWNKWSGTHSTTTKNYTFTMPANNVTDTATATKVTTTMTTTTTAPTVNYTVKHWLQNIGAATTQNSTNYTLDNTETFTGKYGSSVTPAVQNQMGFTAPSTKTVTLGNSTVVNYYYTRNSYKLTVIAGTGIASVTGSGTYQYGSTVRISATVKSGYKFYGWYSTGDVLELLDVTSFPLKIPSRNETFTAKAKASVTTTTTTTTQSIKCNSFSSDSWSTIKYNIQNNNSSCYKVGDTKVISVGGTNFTVRVANNSNYNCGYASKTACGFVVEFVDIVEKRAMNSSSTNAGGWASSDMRTYLNGEFLTKLPSDLQSVIVNTTVVSSHGSNASSNFTSIDKLFLLSTSEIWTNGLSNDTARSSTRQLDYYSNKGVTTTYNFNNAKKSASNGISTQWWLRSAYSTSPYLYIYVDKNGYYFYNNAYDTSTGVAPAFRIG